jgi:hypothetical protein
MNGSFCVLCCVFAVLFMEEFVKTFFFFFFFLLGLLIKREQCVGCSIETKCHENNINNINNIKKINNN